MAASSVIVGISDCKVTRDADSVLVTYALGSCIAVAMHDPVTKVSGLLHYMLPESNIDAKKAEQNPYMFADTGIPRLIEAVKAAGGDARKTTPQPASDRGGVAGREGRGEPRTSRRSSLTEPMGTLGRSRRRVESRYSPKSVLSPCDCLCRVSRRAIHAS